jgi:hypothetical protein
VLIRESVVRLDADDHCNTISLGVIDDPVRHIVPKPVDFTVFRSNSPIGEVEGRTRVVEDWHVVLVVVLRVPPMVNVRVDTATWGNPRDEDPTEALGLYSFHQFGNDWEHLGHLEGNRIPHRFVFITEPRHIASLEVRPDILVANPYVSHLGVRGPIGSPSEVIETKEVRVVTQPVPQRCDIEVIGDKTEVHTLSVKGQSRYVYAYLLEGSHERLNGPLQFLQFLSEKENLRLGISRNTRAYIFGVGCGVDHLRLKALMSKSMPESWKLLIEAVLTL